MPLCSACFSILNITEPVALCLPSMEKCRLLFHCYGPMAALPSLFPPVRQWAPPLFPQWGNGHLPCSPPVRQWAHVCVGWHWPKDCVKFYTVLSNCTLPPPTQSNSKRQWHLSLSCSPQMRQWAHASWPWPKDLMRFQMVLVYCRHSLINWWDFSEPVGSTSGRWGRWLCWSPPQAAWTVSPGSRLLNPAYAEK